MRTSTEIAEIRSRCYSLSTLFHSLSLSTSRAPSFSPTLLARAPRVSGGLLGLSDSVLAPSPPPPAVFLPPAVWHPFSGPLEKRLQPPIYKTRITTRSKRSRSLIRNGPACGEEKREEKRGREEGKAFARYDWTVIIIILRPIGSLPACARMAALRRRADTRWSYRSISDVTSNGAI